MVTKLWTEKTKSIEDYEAIFGQLDSNRKLLEDKLSVRMRLVNGMLQLSGEEYDIELASHILNSMQEVIDRQNYISKPEVEYLINIQQEDTSLPVAKLLKEVLITTAAGKPIRAKTMGQKRYVDAITENGFTFGIGPAGTGKTYLAMAMAIKAFKAGEVNRIILTRPAVEAGESLGFLPGDLQEKIDPYLRPLYDAIYEILGPDSYLKLKEKGQIEVAPLAYMRGRTLDNSFIVLDEAQNTSLQQMKMFLTRLGYGSKAVITGDVTQIDLPYGKKSGLKIIQNILKGIDGVGFCYFNRADVVRHPLVQRVIDAFDKYDSSLDKKSVKKEKHNFTRRKSDSGN